MNWTFTWTHTGEVSDPNNAPTHEQCEETNGHTREYLKLSYHELIEFIPVDEQAKENSEHAAARSSHLLQVELVQIDEWLRCVAFAEVFVAADYQPADDIVKKNYIYLKNGWSVSLSINNILKKIVFHQPFQ